MNWWNNGFKNVRSIEQPGLDYIRGQIKGKKRGPYSPERVEKVAKSLRGRVSKVRGKTIEEIMGLERSIEHRIHLSKKAKERVSKIGIPSGSFKKGNVPWSKGLTKIDDERINQLAIKRTGQKRSGNYAKGHMRWCGEKNPWFGKKRSGIDSPRYNSKRHSREYLDYSNEVKWLTEENYSKYKDQINPQNYPRTLCGVPGGYQLDHKFPVYQAFLQEISPEIISQVDNLQMLPWRENLLKSSKI